MGYYRTLRAFHRGGTNTRLPQSWDIMGGFDAFAHVGMIHPRPSLMITGTKAATRWYSEDAVAKAKEPRRCTLLMG